MPSSSARRLAWGFLLLAGLTYALIVLGALVRAHGAGLACPDWPLCFGEVVPRFDLRIAFEWSHRAIAGGISLLFTGLSIAAFRDTDTRPAVIHLIVASGVALALQILLGALTVWQLLASWTVTSHLLVGNAFALGLALITARLFRLSGHQTGEGEAPIPASLRAGLTLTGLLLVLQIVLGGRVSSTYAGLACPEWPTCNGGLWFPTWSGNVGLHLLHRLNGYTLFIVLAASATAARSDPFLRRITNVAFAIGLLEVMVGIANVRLGIPADITGLHSGLAAALVLTLTLALRDVLTRSPIWQPRE